MNFIYFFKQKEEEVGKIDFKFYINKLKCVSETRKCAERIYIFYHAQFHLWLEFIALIFHYLYIYTDAVREMYRKFYVISLATKTRAYTQRTLLCCTKLYTIYLSTLARLLASIHLYIYTAHLACMTRAQPMCVSVYYISVQKLMKKKKEKICNWILQSMCQRMTFVNPKLLCWPRCWYTYI